MLPEPAGTLTREHGRSLSEADMSASREAGTQLVSRSFWCAVGSRAAVALAGLGKVSVAITSSDSWHRHHSKDQ